MGVAGILNLLPPSKHHVPTSKIQASFCEMAVFVSFVTYLQVLITE